MLTFKSAEIVFLHACKKLQDTDSTWQNGTLIAYPSNIQFSL